VTEYGSDHLVDLFIAFDDVAAHFDGNLFERIDVSVQLIEHIVIRREK
jgi:hypothetical protein